MGITRAKTKVYLIYAQQRMLYGKLTPNAPSRFIDDIPEELVDDIYSSSMPSPEVDLKTDVLDQRVVDIKKGEKVKHSHFGIGTVVESNKNELVVIFKKIGVKKLDKYLAPLEKLES